MAQPNVLTESDLHDTFARLLQLMKLTDKIVDAIASAEDNKRTETLATQSMVLSRGLRAIWHNYGWFRHDMQLLTILKELTP